MFNGQCGEAQAGDMGWGSGQSTVLKVKAFCESGVYWQWKILTLLLSLLYPGQGNKGQTFGHKKPSSYWHPLQSNMQKQYQVWSIYTEKSGIRNHLFTLTQILAFPVMDHYCDSFKGISGSVWCLLVQGIASSKPILSKWLSQIMAGSLVLSLMQTGMWSTCNTVGFTTSVVIYAVSALTVPQWAGGNWKVFSVSVFEASQRNIMLLLFECSFLIEVEFLEAFLPTTIYKMQFSMKHVMTHQ